MLNFKFTGACVLTLFALAACDQIETPSFKVQTNPLPDSTITLDGETYTLKRATAITGRRAGQEVWAIVVDGKTYSCGSASEENCQRALDRAKREELRQEDMGY